MGSQDISGFVPSRRVTHPLHGKARDRLVGDLLSYFSWASENSNDDSLCLSELVHGFLQDDSVSESQDNKSDSDPADESADCADVVEGVLALTLNHNRESYRNVLLAHVFRAVEVHSWWRNETAVLRRKVMKFLKDLGHNAAVCQTRWESSGNLTAGNYEFIDVMESASDGTRYIVDVDFAAQFEIARPTGQYSKVLQSLPRVFVGKGEDLKRIVKTMCDVARISLKSRGLSLPPWRKNRFMQNKWLGPYTRTTNLIPSSSFMKPTVFPVNGVKCRMVGFDDTVNGRFVVHTR
ncbi:hypothetical protein K2173_000646 [Erythroxylum novogranatense]|uniref:Uncharacterized protein n=1 Tax=Erythroxylum novogranatense TaxID=1862640 RepID=A0AAV8S873_9ROSI|nr:hypothetical protein K2173_000646 [Erythroxylum novogranatense]